MLQFTKPKDCRGIEEIRKEIDKIDHQILSLFAIRNEFVKEIVAYKRDEKGVIAAERKNFVINERAREAGELGMNPEVFRKMFTLLIDDNIKKELELLQENGSGKTV